MSTVDPGDIPEVDPDQLYISRCHEKINRLEDEIKCLKRVIESALFCNLDVPLPKHIVDDMREAMKP